MSNFKDYTIGWISPDALALVAATLFFDEEFETPRLPVLNGEHTYKCGRIGRHNVVVAVVPFGCEGPGYTADVAVDMKYSFPNIRAVLLVGTASGAPANHDIRLGDVVVGTTSGNGKGAVVKYNYYMTAQNLITEPPEFMVEEMDTLMATNGRKDLKLSEAIANAISQNSRLQTNWRRPDASTDRLYRSDVIHTGKNNESCEVSCGDDESKLVPRPTRSANQDEPVIHHGRIATHALPMGDALRRDDISTKEDVLCFETGAAEVIRNSPSCLIIRGICDYGDTHKNSLWKRYASIAAAAYARDHLRAMGSEEKLSEAASIQEYSNLMAW
ncbi:nucleoside phosphorylase domain-containing protein [Nemania abortiva]|nr:nucleoside phosphorylase domain-containing protein [Nemania abortiva]